MTHEEYKDWMKSLKTGDEVAIDVSWRNSRKQKFTILKIERETKTQLISGTWRWRKDDGYVVGGSYDHKLQPVTQQVRDTIARRRVEVRFLGLVEEKNLETYTTEQLQSVIDILKGEA